MLRSSSGPADTLTPSLLAGSIVHRITHAAAWVLSHFRKLNDHHLTPEECEAQGLPEGATEPHIYVQPIACARWWHIDAWTDGDCLHLRALGWWGEVHYHPKASGSEAPGHPEATA